MQHEQTTGRYERGVLNPKPELVARIRQAMAEDPCASKSVLARRVGVSRATLSYYLRAMAARARVADATKVDAELSTITHDVLLGRLDGAARDVAAVIGELRQLPTTPTTAGAIFRGYGTLERIYRQLAELLGQLHPPSTNIYLTQVQTLLTTPVDPREIPNEVSEAIAEETADGPTR